MQKNWAIRGNHNLSPNSATPGTEVTSVARWTVGASIHDAGWMEWQGDEEGSVEGESMGEHARAWEGNQRSKGKRGAGLR